MIYVCSDLHGEYELFKKLLRLIGFSQKDEMIICGDILDKGTGSVQLLNFISNYKNFSFILGNHEHDFLKYYDSLMRNRNNNYDWVLKKLQEYFSTDGELLSWKHIDWLEEQPYYIEREHFICVHSGIPILSSNNLVEIKDVVANQFVYDRKFKEPTVLPNTEKCIFYGHTPSVYLTGVHEIIAYPKVENPKTISDFIKIHLDIGTWLGGGVGCLCINSLQCFYVTAKGETHKKMLR